MGLYKDWEREKGANEWFQMSFRGHLELQMQVFIRTGIGVPSYFISPWGEYWGPPVSEPSAELVKLQTPLVMGMGCKGCKLSKHLKGFWAHTNFWDTTGFLEQ